MHHWESRIAGLAHLDSLQVFQILRICCEHDVRSHSVYWIYRFIFVGELTCLYLSLFDSSLIFPFLIPVFVSFTIWFQFYFPQSCGLFLARAGEHQCHCWLQKIDAAMFPLPDGYVHCWWQPPVLKTQLGDIRKIKCSKLPVPEWLQMVDHQRWIQGCLRNMGIDYC